MRMTIGMALLLLTGVATGGDAKKDVDQLQGKWVGETNGLKLELTFAKNAFIFNIVDKGDYKGTFKLDPTKKLKEIDMKVSEGDPFKGKTSLGIYELDGDTLKWCTRDPGTDKRPTSFNDKGPGVMFVIYKRAK